MNSKPKINRDKKDSPNPTSITDSKHSKNRMKNLSDNKKVQVTFSKGGFEHIDEICKEIGIKPTEFVRQACDLLAWAYDEIKEGKKIGSFNREKSEYSWILLPSAFSKRN